MSNSMERESSPNKTVLPAIATALEGAKMTSPPAPAAGAEDQPHFTTKHWNIVSPGQDQSASGPVRKSRIGEVIRDTSLRRKPQKFPDWAVTCLTQWFSEHSSYPYPTPEEKEMLAEQTKLSEVQINYWFSNARRRRSKKEKQSAMSSSQNERGTHPPPPPMHSGSPDPNFGRGSAHHIVPKQPTPIHPSSATSLTIPTHQLQHHFNQQQHHQILNSPQSPSYSAHHLQTSSQNYSNSSPYPPMPSSASHSMSLPSQFPMHARSTQFAQAPPPPPPSHHIFTGLSLPPLQSPPGSRPGLPLPFPSLPPPPKD